MRMPSDALTRPASPNTLYVIMTMIVEMNQMSQSNAVSVTFPLMQIAFKCVYVLFVCLLVYTGNRQKRDSHFNSMY